MGRKPTTENAFLKLLSEEQGPLYWIGVDRTIRYVNETMAQWLGVEREKLEGVRAEYHSVATEAEPHLLVNSLCPAAEVFDGTQTHFQLRLVRQGALPSRHSAQAMVLRGGDGSELGLLVTITTDPLGHEPKKRQLDSLHLRVAQIREEQTKLAKIDRFLGVSPASKRIREQVTLAAESDASTLIVGPPGSGRETIARAIFAAGAASRRLLPIQCRQLDAEMLRSMVDMTAFRKPTSGVVSQVLLMLEVDQLDHAAQLALREVFREPKPPRVLSTARQSLRALAEQGKFDTALCDHLSVLRIESPALAERREDIPILAQAFLERLNPGRDIQLAGFAPEAMDLLVCYSWPGNIDQLAEIVRQAADTATKPLIYASQLPERIKAARHAAEHPREPATAPIELDAILQQVERELIERALSLAGGNKSKAASLLSLPRNRLLRKLELLKIDSPRSADDELELPDFRPISEFPNLAARLDAE